MKLQTNVRAGGLALGNHNQAGLSVRSAVRASGLAVSNHCEARA